MSRNAEKLLEKVHDEVEGLEGSELASKLDEVGADVVADAPPEQRRAAYCLARVKKLVEPVLLARTNFYDESGVFRQTQCEAYARGVKKTYKTKSKNDRLRTMIKDVSGTPAPGSLKSNDALETALVEAYQAKPPAAVEASKYNPLAAPKIEEVIKDHGEQLRGDANDAAVLEAVAETAVRVMKTKGSPRRRTSASSGGDVVVVGAILGRTVGRYDGKIFEDFKAATKGNGGLRRGGIWLLPEMAPTGVLTSRSVTTRRSTPRARSCGAATARTASLLFAL